MVTFDDALSAIGDWRDNPNDRLRRYPDGTMFLLRTSHGRVDLCWLVGNMEGDENLTAQRLSDLKIVSLRKQRIGSTFLVLSDPADQEQP